MNNKQLEIALLKLSEDIGMKRIVLSGIELTLKLDGTLTDKEFDRLMTAYSILRTL